MNLLVCKEEWRLENSNRFLIQDPNKIKHITTILKKESGSYLRAGLIDQSLGSFKILESSHQEILGTYRPILSPLPRIPEVHVLLAINRPPTVRKILQLAGTWGVRSITFFLTQNSRKDYLTSPVWNPPEMESELIEGMEQGKNIFLPSIRLDFNRKPNEILEQTLQEKKFEFRFLLDRKGDSVSKYIKDGIVNTQIRKEKLIRILVAIGPESGFVRSEIEFWKQNDFCRVNLSKQVLRTETATAFLLSRLEEKSLYF
ncbi:RsmE family RNA methyltransferase [Leptospira sp. WS92.C1]